MKKKIAWFFLLFALSPIIVTYFYGLNGAAIWCWVWAGLLAWFANSKQDIFNRGLIFTILSIALAISGKSLLKGKESDDVLEMLSQVFLIIGGGVGGNFMAHYLLSKKP